MQKWSPFNNSKRARTTGIRIENKNAEAQAADNVVAQWTIKMKISFGNENENCPLVHVW